jgi:DNA-binding NarL/FixJ family response regulator
VTRILIVGEIRLYREGLVLVLDSWRGMEAAGAVRDVPEALAAFGDLEPDVVLLDVAGADPVGAVLALMAAEPDMRIVVLGVDDDEPEVMAFAEAGVSGYVSRGADKKGLCTALESVARGETLCSPRVAATLLKRVAALSAQRSEMRTTRLTIREREIVALMRDGLSNKEIAKRLSIEVATVKNHVHNILDKLDVRRRGDVATALRA